MKIQEAQPIIKQIYAKFLLENKILPYCKVGGQHQLIELNNTKNAMILNQTIYKEFEIFKEKKEFSEEFLTPKFFGAYQEINIKFIQKYKETHAEAFFKFFQQLSYGKYDNSLLNTVVREFHTEWNEEQVLKFISKSNRFNNFNIKEILLYFKEDENKEFLLTKYLTINNFKLNNQSIILNFSQKNPGFLREEFLAQIIPDVYVKNDSEKSNKKLFKIEEISILSLKFNGLDVYKNYGFESSLSYTTNLLTDVCAAVIKMIGGADIYKIKQSENVEIKFEYNVCEKEKYLCMLENLIDFAVEEIKNGEVHSEQIAKIIYPKLQIVFENMMINKSLSTDNLVDNRKMVKKI